jgi:hypothetical protein
MIQMMCNEQAKFKEATRHLQEEEDQRARERVKGEEQARVTVKAQDRRVASTSPGTSGVGVGYPFALPVHFGSGRASNGQRAIAW